MTSSFNFLLEERGEWGEGKRGQSVISFSFFIGGGRERGVGGRVVSFLAFHEGGEGEGGGGGWGYDSYGKIAPPPTSALWPGLWFQCHPFSNSIDRLAVICCVCLAAAPGRLIP